MAEVDFPRGKPVSTEAEKKPKSVKGTVPYSKKSRKQTSKTKKGGSTNKSHQVVPAKVQFELTAESFHKDVLVLGCVNEVHNDEIIVELPNNSKGVVSHGGAGLGLVAGQVIAVGVTGAATTAGAGAGATGGAAGGARLMALTMQPDILNQNLSRPDIRQGMYISGVVSSVEDRGYTVTTEIKDTTSFIAAKDTKARLVVGQPVFCVVSSISPDSGHLFLIPQRTEDATFTEIRNWKSVAMVHVRPGNAVKAEVVRKFPTGLSVRIYNQPATSPLSVFIPVAHLHKPIEYYNIGFRVNGRVIFVDYSSQRVMVSTLPHLLNYSETTTLFDQYENLRGLVFPVTLPASSRPTCSLPTVPPASAVVVSNSTLPEQVTDVDSIDTESKQTQTDVKVTGVSYYMGMLQVSSDPEVVESATSTLRVQDLHPGMLVDGSVSEVSKAGIEVKISPLISGKCSAIHLSDAPSVLRVDSLFSAEQSTQCRILYIDEDENVHLTNKPTLVNSALRVISSYHHAIPGCVAHGWVSKVTKSEVTVSFYDNVTGLVPSSDIEGSPTESYPVGTAVACQVVECEEVQGSYKLQLTFDIQLARPVPSPPVLTKVRQAFSAAVIGDKVSGVVSHTDINALTLTLDSGVTAILPTQHLSDQHTICSTLITRYYIGTHMTDLVVLNKDSSNMRLVLSNKPSLRLSPVKYEDIKVGDVIPGHVKQISDSNYTIGFLGTWKAQVARKPESRVGYVLGQSVRALVTAILGNGGLAVDLEDVSTKTNGVSLLQEYFKGVDGLWSRTKIAKLYPIASVVSGKVVEHRGGQVVVLLANNVIALAQEHVTEYPIGQSVKGVVIDIDYTNAMVRLCLKKDIVDHIVSSSAIPTGKDLLGKVLHLTGSYVVVCVTITPDSRTIVYAPLGDYNTQGLGKEHFTHLLPGNSVHVTKPDSEGSKLHPIVALKSSRSTTPVDTDVKIEDASDEEQDDLSALVKPPTFIDEEDGEFQYVESDDSDNDPDRDDLQEYLNRVAKAKVIEAKSKNGTTNSKNSVPKDKNTQVQQKVQSKVQYSKEKRKSEVKQNSNKKMKIKK